MAADIAHARRTIGVDVGGTFTDLFFFDEATGQCDVAKVPSTPADQAIGFMDGIAQQVNDLSTVQTIVHGTTVGTNALLERKGAPTGIITTQGFRDILEMRRRDRPHTWGLWGTFEPVVPRDRRIDVPERTLADGTIHEAVDLDAVKAAAKTLLDRGAQALVIFFVNAYANSANEMAALDAVRSVWPNDHIVASSEILPEIREFERASTTTLNASLQPVIGAYLGSLEGRLGDGGFGGQLLIVQSNGGVMTVETAKRRPIRTALSGPSAGVIAGGHIARAAGFPNVITGDMGGTSFDVALIVGGESALAAQTTIDFGMVVRTPMIEMTTIGAGGGSIAWVDRGGLLQIGPESAGADPGPVCYGLGNDRPTVTDANVVLGRINAERPIGGKLDRLDVEASKQALLTHVGAPLGMDAEEAAEAVIRVANAAMAGAIRLVSIERGHDPTNFALMPFGGGGALHAGALIQDVGLAQALVPRFPGVTSALGCIIADMRHDFVRTLNKPLDAVEIAALDADIVSIAREGATLLDSAGASFDARQTVVEFDMSYVGQTHTVVTPIDLEIDSTDSGVTTDGIRVAFESAYRRIYGRLLDDVPIRLLNLRMAVIGKRPQFDLTALRPADGLTIEAARTGERQVRAKGQWRPTPIFDRLALPVGAEIAGPAILEQADTTIFVDPGLGARVDDFGNVILERETS